MNTDLAKELKKNTEIVEATFDRYNCRVVNYSYLPKSETDADCELIIEISTDGADLYDDVYIKLNMYDEEGEIFYYTEQYIDSYDFPGFDTYIIELEYHHEVLKRAKAARIYLSSRLTH